MNRPIIQKSARDLAEGDVIIFDACRAVVTRVGTANLNSGMEISFTRIGMIGTDAFADRAQFPFHSQFTVELPASLTPVQAAADKLLGHAQHLRDLLNTYPALLSEREEVELRSLLDELEPPKPPTLEEALAVLRQLDQSAGDYPAPIGSTLEAARFLLKRVPN